MTESEAQEPTPLEKLHLAIQEFSNSLVGTTEEHPLASPPGVVRSAVVVWQEAAFEDDGEHRIITCHTTTGDDMTPALGLGLLHYGILQMTSDINP